MYVEFRTYNTSYFPYMYIRKYYIHTYVFEVGSNFHSSSFIIATYKLKLKCILTSGCFVANAFSNKEVNETGACALIVDKAVPKSNETIV